MAWSSRCRNLGIGLLWSIEPGRRMALPRVRTRTTTTSQRVVSSAELFKSMTPPSFSTASTFRMLEMSASGIGAEQQHVAALACLKRAELVESLAGQDSIFRGRDDRLRGRHAHLDQSFDGDDRAEPGIEVLRLLSAPELWRLTDDVVGTHRDDGAARDELPGVRATHLQVRDQQVAFLREA